MIRAARLDDASSVAAIYAPIVRDTVISFEESVPSVEEISGRIERTLAEFPYLVFDDSGRVLGYAYAGRIRERASYRWSVEVTVYVDAPARRRGVARALYERLFELLSRQNFVHAYAGITLPNAASVGLHEALGFTPVGVYRSIGYKFGAWHDVGFWQRALRARPPRPQEPIPFPKLGT